MASAVLDQIKAELESQLATGVAVSIDQAIRGIPGADGLLRAVCGSDSMAVTDASVSAINDVLFLRGQSMLLDSTRIPVEFQFRDDGGLVVYIEGRVPALTPLAESAAKRFFKGGFAVPAGLVNLRIKTVTVVVTIATKSALVVFADTGDTEVAAFLNVRQPRLSLAATRLDQAVPEVTARFEGLLVVANVLFAIKGQLGGEGGFSVVPTGEPATLTTQQLLQSLLSETVSQVPDLELTDVGLIANLESGNVQVSARVTGSWEIPLGVGSQALTDVTIAVAKREGVTTGRITGRMSIAGQSMSVQAGLPGELILSGELLPLDLADLARALTGANLTIPAGLPAVRLETSHFAIRFEGGSPTFTAQTRVDGLGAAGFVVTKISGEWQTLVVFATPDDFRFSRLTPILAPLDVLSIEHTRLVIASFDAEAVPLPSAGDVRFPSRASKGLVLEADLALRGQGLDFVSGLLGKSQLPLRLAAGSDLAASEISASLGGRKVLVPGVLTLENVDLAFVASPFTVTLRSEASVVIDGESLPKFRIGAALSDGSQKLTLETSEPWEKPFGVSGLTIRKAVLDVQTAPTPAYGILGDIEVAGRILRIACQFVGSAPTALIGELQGRLSLGEVVRDLVGFGLPPALDLSIEDFSLQLVSNPLGVTIGSEHFDPGLSLRGTLGILGLETLVNVRVRQDSGVFASGALKSKVEFGTIFSITDSSGDGPPAFHLDTNGSPMLKLSGRVNLLGMTDSIDAALDRSGLTVRLRRNLGIGKYDLDVKFESVRAFRAVGAFEFGLSATIRTDLGSIMLDTGCSGTLTVAMSDGAFEMVADGQFSFAGSTLNIPTFRSAVQLDSLDSLPPQIRDLIADRAREVFASVLDDPGRWVQAIAARAIQDVENVAQILKNRFGKDASYIGDKLKLVLNRSSLEVGQALTGIGESPERIANVLRDLGDQASNVRDTLTRLNVPADRIRSIMSSTFPSIPHLDDVLHTDVHADTPLVPPVNLHADTPLVPPVSVHGDTPLVPPINLHADTPLVPHIDSHADTPLVPRVNEHTDYRGPGISNHLDRRIAGRHIDRHDDVPGPHVDAHLDTPGQAHVDVHTDSPQRAHVDTHTDRAGRAHVDTHVDTPGRAHVDTHTDTPSQARVDTHGDTSVHTDVP